MLKDYYNIKQINKQTNKQTKTFLDPKYHGQIKSDLFEIFRETSFGCPMTIKVKNEHVHNQKKQISK